MALGLPLAALLGVLCASRLPGAGRDTTERLDLGRPGGNTSTTSSPRLSAEALEIWQRLVQPVAKAPFNPAAADNILPTGVATSAFTGTSVSGKMPAGLFGKFQPAQMQIPLPDASAARSSSSAGKRKLAELQEPPIDLVSGDSDTKLLSIKMSRDLRNGKPGGSDVISSLAFEAEPKNTKKAKKSGGDEDTQLAAVKYTEGEMIVDDRSDSSSVFEMLPDYTKDAGTMLDATTYGRCSVPAQDPGMSRADTLRAVRALLARTYKIKYGVYDVFASESAVRVLLGQSLWVSGDIIDAYTSLLQERASAAGRRELFLPALATSDIHKLLTGRSYHESTVFARPLVDDIRKYDRLFLPFHIGESHWVLVLVDMAARTIAHYDSLVHQLRAAADARRALTPAERKAVFARARGLLHTVQTWVEGELRLARGLDARTHEYERFGSERRYYTWIQQRLNIAHVAQFQAGADIRTYFPEWVTAVSDPDRRPWTLAAAEDAPQQNNGNDCGVFTLRVAQALSAGEPLATVSQERMPALRAEVLEAVMVGRLPGDAGVLRPIYEHISKKRAQTSAE